MIPPYLPSKFSHRNQLSQNKKNRDKPHHQIINSSCNKNPSSMTREICCRVTNFTQATNKINSPQIQKN